MLHSSNPNECADAYGYVLMWSPSSECWLIVQASSVRKHHVWTPLPPPPNEGVR